MMIAWEDHPIAAGFISKPKKGIQADLRARFIQGDDGTNDITDIL
jgi:hypothetical protein